MRKFRSPLLPLFPTLMALACLAAAPAGAQSFTFISDGTGPYFTDTLTTGHPHAVDFFSKTSGQSAGKDSILTITGYGNAGVTYTNTGSRYYEDTDLTTASVLLQDAASRSTLFSGAGSLHYQFITSPNINTLSLTGTAFDTGGTPWQLDFFKDEQGGTVTTHFTQSPVPEFASSTSLGLMLGPTLAALLWSTRKRRRSVRDE